MGFLDASFGLAGERKATALLCLAFYTAFFSLVALVMANAPPDQPEMRAWWACFAALAGYYGVGFFALAAGWFWGRWFAIGIGYAGVTLAGWTFVTQRSLDPVMTFYGLTHGIIALFLQGERLVAEYDAKPQWRQLLGLDEEGVRRVRHTVTRSAASLPTLIVIALAPRESQGALLAVAGLGLLGVLMLRTWGIVLLAGVGLALPLSLLMHNHAGDPIRLLPLHIGSTSPVGLHLLGFTAAALLLSACAPFARPIYLRLRGRAS